jgi:kumamolisin
MKNSVLGYLRYLMVFMLMLTLNIGVALDKTSNQSTVRLSGHVPSKAVSQALFKEHLDSNVSVPITFVLPLRNQEALEQLIQQINNPADQQHYGKYLTSAEFIENFAPTQEDYDTIIAYVKKLGLDVIGIHPNRILLNVSGPTKSIEAAFQLKLNMYQQTNGRKFYAPDDEPEVPVAIASIINGIVGLDNSAVWHAYNRRQEISKEMLNAPNAASFPSGPGGGYAPNDIKIAYNLNGVSANGSGQKVALFELGAYLASDITAYATYFGLPSANLTNVLVDGGSGGAIDPEVALDIELVLALAPQSQVYVYEGPNSSQGVLDTYNRIATDNIAKQVSTSWGLGENEVSSQSLQAENTIFQQMAAQGQTIYAAAGDSGAYDDYPSKTLVVNDPASQPYVVGVGGTSLTVNATTGAYASETVWNDGLGNGAGGGGVSSVWPIPSWQTNVSTVYSKTNRNVPDISLNADQLKGYAIFYNGQWSSYGGTSCAAPLWAAFTALVNEQRQAAAMSVLGFANPPLYTIGTTAASQTLDYHDITVGNNLFYQAGPGYDNASGWGSFNGANLFASLTQSSTDIPSVSITSPANGATVSGTINITANASDPVGTITHVDFYVDSTLIVSDNAAPYTATLDTTGLSNGQHTLKAIAYNNAGNSAQSVVTVTANNALSSFYINAGGSALTDSCTGVTWQADQYYSGGQTKLATSLPTCLGVYTSERYGNFSYNIPVSNGPKYVILKFAEIYFHTAGSRVFGVNINGVNVISNLDIFKEVGYAKPLDLSFPVTVTNNSIKISFIQVVENPKISGVEILPQ